MKKIINWSKVNKLVKTGTEYADTDYLTGYQYRSSYTQAQGNQSTAVLQYFPHAEGYVQHNEGHYFYVYHYTDHLGNIRLSYGLDPETGLIKIMEENHYYPFGLKHDNYNTQHLGYSTYTDEHEIEYIVLAEMPKFVGDGSYNVKYQGQERQDELGLNWDSFKYRNYDYALGRFMSIDPLAESYTYNSPYAFQENKIGLGREFEGLELVYRKGTNSEFKAKFVKTVEFMNSKGTSGLLSKLNNLSKTELVDNTGKGSFYKPSEQAIYFDPTAGVETTEGHLLSPATVINHEFDHAVQHKENPEKFMNDIDSFNSFDENYDTLEEKRVITGSEQETALKHGEIKEGEVTRKDHSGLIMSMPDPTSTNNATPVVRELDEIILTAPAPKND